MPFYHPQAMLFHMDKSGGGTFANIWSVKSCIELRKRIDLTLCTGFGAQIMMKALTRHWGHQTHAAERWRIGTASSRRAPEKLGFTVSRLVSAAALSPASQAPNKLLLLLLLLLQNTTQCRPGYSTTQATL